MPITGDITPSLVARAAAAAGVLLEDAGWYEPAEGDRPAHACGLGVLILAEHPDLDFARRLERPFLPAHAAKLLGIDAWRVEGFVVGFGGLDPLYAAGYLPEYDRGHAEGVACRRELAPAATGAWNGG
jgi:hypothetical protein